jgi:hypothetical protein
MADGCGSHRQFQRHSHPRAAVLLLEERLHDIETRNWSCVNKEVKGNMAHLRSKYNILSEDAFDLDMYRPNLRLLVRQVLTFLGVGRSVQGIPFPYWLPLPLLISHWERARDDVDLALCIIAPKCRLRGR